MLGSIRRRAAQFFLAAFAAGSLLVAAQAGTINIILSDMDVSYLGNVGGGALFDAMGGFSGGVLNPATSDDISTAVFELDGVIQGGGPLVDDSPDSIHADLQIANIGPTITKNNFYPTIGASGGGFGFDLYIDPPGAAPPTPYLRLGMTDISLLLTNGVFFFTGEATVLAQNLPFGLAFGPGQTVQFSYTATLPAVPNANPVTTALGSGAFTISGLTIPEPTTNLLLCTGLSALGFFAIRRRRRVPAFATVVR